jgi:uncharacterized membrane protein YkoI
MKGKLKGSLITIAAIAMLAGGGAAIAGAKGGDHGHKRGQQADRRDDRGKGRDRGDTHITGAALARASQVALGRTGGGRVTDTELGDEEGYYEVEVTRTDGSQVDVHLDRDFNVIDSSQDGD